MLSKLCLVVYIFESFPYQKLINIFAVNEVSSLVEQKWAEANKSFINPVTISRTYVKVPRLLLTYVAAKRNKTTSKLFKKKSDVLFDLLNCKYVLTK